MESVSEVIWLVHGIPDLDNIAPVIYLMLEQGVKVSILCEPCTTALLKKNSIFNFMLNSGCAGISYDEYIMMLETPCSAGCRIFVCDWGRGLPQSLYHRFLFAIKREVLSFRQMVLSYAVRSEVPIIAFPHGINTRVDVKTKKNSSYRSLLNKLSLSKTIEDYSDREVFDLYVFNSEYYRRVCKQFYRMQRVNTYVLGPYKYMIWWQDILRGRVYQTIGETDGHCNGVSELRRVAFFLPKWVNNIKVEFVEKLLEDISDLDNVQVLLQAHPRRGTSEPTDNMRELMSLRPNVTVSQVTSRELLYSSDLLVDFGSSMSIDALAIGIPVIYPEYCQSNTSVLNKLDGVYVVADSAEARGLVANCNSLSFDYSNVCSELNVPSGPNEATYELEKLFSLVLRLA